MMKQFGEKIEALENAHAVKREKRNYHYSEHEKKYLIENPLWHEQKFIGSKKFCAEMRGLDPPVVEDSGFLPSTG